MILEKYKLKNKILSQIHQHLLIGFNPIWHGKTQTSKKRLIFLVGLWIIHVIIVRMDIYGYLNRLDLIEVGEFKYLIHFKHFRKCLCLFFNIWIARSSINLIITIHLIINNHRKRNRKRIDKIQTSNKISQQYKTKKNT